MQALPPPQSGGMMDVQKPMFQTIVAADPSEPVQIWGSGPACPSGLELRKRFRLSPRQAVVAHLLVARATNTEIAACLDIGIWTAKHHVEAVLLKLGICCRTEVEGRILRYGDGP